MRDQGVAIVGSGMSYHDLRHFRDGDTTASAAFDAWLDETAKAPEAEREARLTQWDKAPSARECHPREEHLLPLMVVAGAAGASEGTRDFNAKIGGKMISAFRLGLSGPGGVLTEPWKRCKRSSPASERARGCKCAQSRRHAPCNTSLTEM